MRVTKHMLENRLSRINRRLGRDYGLENAPHYGGWKVTSNKGATVVYGRVGPREMLAYLDGLLAGMDMLDGAYQ